MANVLLYIFDIVLISWSKNFTTTLCMWTTFGKIKMHYLILSGDHHVMKNLVIHNKMNCVFLLECFLAWKDKLRSQFNCLLRLGVVHLVGWLIMDLKGCQNLKIPDVDYVLPQFIESTKV